MVVDENFSLWCRLWAAPMMGNRYSWFQVSLGMSSTFVAFTTFTLADEVKDATVRSGERGAEWGGKCVCVCGGGGWGRTKLFKTTCAIGARGGEAPHPG
jgi:hypothetical protein